MCGIAAIFAYSFNAPGVDVGELTTIRDHMTVRGPDGCGLWLDETRRLGLGHRRLSILDLSDAGAQPMHLPERQLAIVFNGEIYNYRELRAQLECRGRVFHSGSDTEVLLHLYADKGRAMLDDLRGMYAFALWDGAQRGLFLARDPYGIKPLYVADDGRTLRVASQVKALLAGGKIDIAPEPAGHVGFFLWGNVPEPYTLYRGVRSLAAGTSLWLDAQGNKQQTQFCSIPALLASSAISNQQSAIGNPSNPNQQLSTALRDSVAHHLVSDVPVGVFLSSGLDSTTLAALAAEQGGQLRTVTLGFEEFRGTASDEVPLAELVARQYGAQHQTVWISRRDFESEAENLFTAMDRPSTDGVNTYFVSLAAKRAGLKVALSGLGGDELFGGYPSFTQIPRTVSAFQLFSLSTLQPLGKAFRLVTAPMLKCFTSPKYASLFEYGGTYGGAYLLRRGMYMPWELPEILDADLVREGWARLNSLSELSLTTQSLKTDRLRVTALESCWYMRHQLLRDSDWAGMAHSLEIRVPLVDTTLLRSLLPSLGSATPPTKRDMALTPNSQLPPAVLNRPKTGFQIPVREWLQSADRKSETGNRTFIERGLRGWVRKVHSRFPGAETVLVRRSLPGAPSSRLRSRISTSQPVSTSALPGNPSPSATCQLPSSNSPPARVLALVTDAYGGFGGISKFNRDLLSSLSSDPTVEKVVAIPRLVPEATGVLPDILEYVTSASGGKLRYVWSVLKSAIGNRQSTIILCGHINLLPLAFLARHFLSFRIAYCVSRATPPPIVLIIHGIDAWQPTGRKNTDRLAHQVDFVVAVSAVTAHRFSSWTGMPAEKVTILPNSFDPAQFSPGPKDPALLTRYRLNGQAVIMTLGRLVSEERYKGFDEVLEVLPALLEEIPNLSYLIAGDGTDRARLVTKAKSLGLRVMEIEKPKAEGGNSSFASTDHAARITNQSPALSAFPAAPTFGAAPQVVFAGRIPESEKVAHYRLADAYVMPSRGEGFGIVYLEALACGIPVVGSKADGSREALRDGKLGTLVDPGNADEIKAAIHAVLQQSRGQVVAGLDYFSYANFQKRCRDLVTSLVSSRSC